MHTVTLGSTNITVNKNAFGALPIQRVPDDYAVMLLKKAYDGGIRFFDTARMYTDSEHKLNLAFSGMREKVFISTKTLATTVEDFWADLEISLGYLGYIDIYQFHNPSFCPKPGDGMGLYEAMLEAKAQGKIRHIGITNHRLSVAKEAIESGLYETLQFPFCYLATEPDLELVKMCAEKNMGFIAMKALSGGLITNSAAAYAYLAQFENVLPIWGVQKENELDEFLSYIDNPPALTEELAAVIEADRKLLLRIRGLSAASLGLTFILLLANFLSINAPQALGDFLYGLLVIVSTPMICGRYWIISLFLWACLLMGSFVKKEVSAG